MSKRGGIAIEGVLTHPVIAHLHCSTGYCGETWGSVILLTPGDVEKELHELALEHASSYGRDEICQSCGEGSGNCDCDDSDWVENENISATALRWQFTKSYAYINGGDGEDEVYQHLINLGVILVDGYIVTVEKAALKEVTEFPGGDQDAREYHSFEQSVRHHSGLFEKAKFTYV